VLLESQSYSFSLLELLFSQEFVIETPMVGFGFDIVGILITFYLIRLSLHVRNNNVFCINKIITPRSFDVGEISVLNL
jgi:hypothetical protein